MFTLARRVPHNALKGVHDIGTSDGLIWSDEFAIVNRNMQVSSTFIYGKKGIIEIMKTHQPRPSSADFFHF